MDYLTKHGPGCQCQPTDKKYPTLCALLTAMRAESDRKDTEITRLAGEVARLDRLPERCASCDNDEHYLEMQRANRAEAEVARLTARLTARPTP